MKILFATGTPYLPQVRGGVEVNTHELATELAARGHAVAVLASLSYKDLYGLNAGLSARFHGHTFSDHDLGYPVFRSRQPWQVIAELDRHDIAVIQNGHPLKMAQAFARRDIRAIVYHNGLGFDSWPAMDPAAHPDRLPIAGYLSVSQFTANRFRARYGIDTEVIPPIVRAERYRTDRRPKYVTFINPVAVKGVDVALAIAARRPEIPFCFVKGWPLSVIKQMQLKSRLRQLPNVVFHERGLADMKAVYSETRVLLVPSQWEAETWGRVASEAHCSGIPVVASDRGGLPESVGPGGVIIRFDAPVEHWINAVDRLWNDDRYYGQKSAAALDYSRRPALDTGHQIAALETALDRFVGRSSEPRSTAPSPSQARDNRSAVGARAGHGRTAHG
jgi:glycosyltransferase involved in cell wall biosynthesis